jgi:amidase
VTAADPCFLTVAEAASLIAAKQLSPVELTRAYLDRIERLNGTLHAYVRVLHDQALTAARMATEEISAGHYRGPLHGVPIGLKDIYDTAGVPTEGGSTVAAELLGSSASRLHQSSLPSSGPAFHGKAGRCLIRRTAVVRTRMPGGVGGAASRDVPLSRLTRVQPWTNRKDQSLSGHSGATTLRDAGRCRSLRFTFTLPISPLLTSLAAWCDFTLQA